MKKSILVHNLNELNHLAETIAKTLKPGYIVGLKGTLGSGKTTFTQFLAKHMGITDNVNSPTFTILKIYKGPLPLYHMDVYRLEDIGYDYELDDFIYGDGVAVIEWFPYIQTMLPNDILAITIEVLNESERLIHLEGSGIYEPTIKAVSNRYSDQ